MAEANVTNTETKLRKCGHCGEPRELSVRAIYNEEWYYEDNDLTGHITWRLLECPACKKPTLEEYSQVEGDFEVDRNILYPLPSSNAISASLPREVASEYESALKIRDISPVACAVLIRRTLEVICQYEKATGKDLNAKIHALAASRRIPQTLADMANLTRQIGNLGAHVDPNDRVTKSDVTTMIDFVEALLEYLYVAPAKIAAVQARLNKTP